MKKTMVVLLLFPLLFGCDAFSTRTPENPDTGRNTYVPPTSPQLALSNFSAAIRELSAENFARCFPSASDTAIGGKSFLYVFEPSAEAAVRFGAIFAGWNSEKERQSFASMKSKIATGAFPTLILTNGRFEIQQPDSSVYVADYYFKPNHSVGTIPAVASGKIRLTMSALPGGFWTITRWSDEKSASDSADETWSTLKASFAN